MAQLPLIAWDVDDVLNELMRSWFEEKWLMEHSSCGLQYNDLTQNPPHALLGISKEEYLNSLDEYRLKEYWKLVPDADALGWFQNHGEKYRHIVVTAVPIRAAHISAEWVYRHYGTWIRGFFVTPTPRSEGVIKGYPAKKQDIFESWIRPDVFIDDNQDNIQQANLCNIKSILRKRPWAGTGDEWAEIAQKLADIKFQGSVT